MELSNLNYEMDDLHITSHVVLDNLPALLKDCLSVAKTTSSRDMLLMSILTSTSSVMNNVSFRYAHYGKHYYPNLLTFIMAGAASGKGVAQLALQLVQQDEPAELGCLLNHHQRGNLELPVGELALLLELLEPGFLLGMYF